MPVRVVANPPFAITSALLKRLVHRGSRLITADLVMTAANRLPRAAFKPRPPADAVVLRIERYQALP